MKKVDKPFWEMSVINYFGADKWNNDFEKKTTSFLRGKEKRSSIADIVIQKMQLG